MKIHIVYIFIIAALVIALGWSCTVFDERKSSWDIQRTMLEKDVTAARDNAERWRVTAMSLQGSTHAQNALAEACLQREANLWEDMQAREEGMALAPPVPITKQQQTLGVSRETRRAFIMYLNGPLE